MRNALIYLASPYTHTSRTIMYKRFRDVCKIAGHLMNNGYYVFCPIAMSHPIQEFGGVPGTWEYWAEYDTKLLKACQALFVVTIDGWKESTGVQAEIQIAKDLGMEISYVNSITGEVTDEPTE